MSGRSISEERLDDAGHPHSLCVLVVEDHPDTRQALGMLLKMLGHRPMLAQNMREGLSVGCAADKEFDLLLSDIQLPDGDGWELLLRLRERGRCPKKAIALSGWGSKEDLVRSKAAGFEIHLVKPLTPGALKAVLSQRDGDALDVRGRSERRAHRAHL